MEETIQEQIRVTPELAGRRLDQVLADLFPDYSRARWQKWAKQGGVLVDGAKVKPSFRVSGNETLSIDVTHKEQAAVDAQEIDLDVVHADDQVVVINKPPGLVVHPAAGNWDGTMLNALLHHFPDLSAIPRAGIVHRLDRLTSGLLVVARSLKAHKSLVDQLQDHSMQRSYLALVHGAMVSGGTVDAPLGRHPKDRKRQAIRETGKEAVTHYRLNTRYRDFTLVNVKLETGRTHQIRVHMSSIRHPLIGDPVYGIRYRPPAGAGDALLSELRAFQRQALHARTLSFAHPSDDQMVTFEAPIPADLSSLLGALDADETQQP
jgi:23S rRNA pseudouridine1911/1915/1917 synthase